MFERFSERARQVVVLAQDEARAFNHNYIGTEHLLLGLLREEEGLAARVLESLDITIEEVRAQVARIIGQGDEIAKGQIPFTPRSKKVLELALREALSLGHNYIGTEHILLGLVRENEGVAARILLDSDADAEKVRDEVIRMLSGPGRREPSYRAPPSATSRSTQPRRTVWEYWVESWPAADLEGHRKRLTGLGTDGWQLAAVVPGGDSAEWVFQRPRAPYRWTTSVVDASGPPRALTVSELEVALADAQKAALEAMDAARVTTISELEDRLTDVVGQIVEAAEVGEAGEVGALPLDLLVERVEAAKIVALQSQDFQLAASIRALERQFHEVLGDIYPILRDSRSSSPGPSSTSS